MSGTLSKLKKSVWIKNSTSLVPCQNLPGSSNQLDFQSPFSAALPSDSLSYTTRSSTNTCAICLSNMKTGEGQAIFTAECSHSFHFTCIANSLKHGNRTCPLCRFKWKELPIRLPNENIPFHYHQSPHQPVISRRPASTLSIRTYTEYPAVAYRDSIPNFAVLVVVRAPALMQENSHGQRVPLDIISQGVSLTITRASLGVRITSIPSSCYASTVSTLGLEGMINIGDLNVGDEKEFLLYLSVPVCSQAGKMTLVSITYSCYEDNPEATKKFKGGSVEINRPLVLSPIDRIVNVRVDRHKNG